ncbi:hypothetical protein B0J17DRAFT_713499 [Rhizoctonia solani]|nr:hypothetical protein B0J17DRAFT_713499 [Rhizoctonia solani]
MSPTPTTDYSSTINAAHTGHEPVLVAAGGQPIATNISTGKKGLAGSVIAGSVIGGAVVALLLVAVSLLCAVGIEDLGGKPPLPPPSQKPLQKTRKSKRNVLKWKRVLKATLRSPWLHVRHAGHTLQALSPEPKATQSRISQDQLRAHPAHKGHSTAPSYQMCPSCAPSRPPPVASRSMSAGTSVRSPTEEHQTYDRQPYISSASPPLPAGAMPPLPSPGLESYAREFKSSPSPQSPPPQSPSSPGGSSLRRWIMSPLSRSGTVNTTLPPYERPASGLQRQESEKKDESALAASVYAFM